MQQETSSKKTKAKKQKLEAKEYLNSVIPNVDIKFKHVRQKNFWEMMDQFEIVLCAGPAGCGKSYLSLAKALSLLRGDNSYQKLILIKPAVEAEEKLGSLPGTMEEKLDPFIYSTMYILNNLIGHENVAKLKQEKIIEIQAMAYLRGVNIDNAVLVLEEAQNISPNQMKTLLTRIGYGAKFIISGDFTQNDRFRDFKQTGLYQGIERLKSCEGVGVFRFSKSDTVRNPIIEKILDRWEEEDAAQDSSLSEIPFTDPDKEPEEDKGKKKSFKNFLLKTLGLMKSLMLMFLQ